MKKLLAILLAAMMLIPGIAAAEMTEDELHAWALANGYVKVGADAITSATTNKAGGVNFGAIEWTNDLQVMAIKEFLIGFREPMSYTTTKGTSSQITGHHA